MKFIRFDCKDFEDWKAKKFGRFVDDRLLDRSDVDLHTFQLHWDYYLPLNDNAVRRWVKYAVKHNVKVLDVILRYYDKRHLPSCIFTCHSLQELNLQWGETQDDLEHIGHVIPDKIKLPSLRKLTLCDVEMDQHSLDSFIAHSPDLEEMHLLHSAYHLDLIASKVLKRLTVYGSADMPKGFTVSAPHLISFKCTGYALEDISLRDQPTLEIARIDACGSTFAGESNFTEILVHAKKLALFGFDIKARWAIEGAETDGRPIDGMTFQCPLLESVMIQCWEGDEGIDKLGNILVVNGVSPDKISVIILVPNKYRTDEKLVTFCEYIKKRPLEEKICSSEEQVKKTRR